LIDAVPRGNEWQNPAPPRRFSPSASWMLELFLVLEQRDEMHIHGHPPEQD
jgi:hypothetical protein